MHVGPGGTVFAMPFQAIETQRLYQQVADQVGALIRRGDFGPGDRLPPERDLAKELRVSRPVVREAMIALELAGLVEVRTGSGTYVKPAGREIVFAPLNLDAGPSPFELLAARKIIEGETAFLAAEMATTQEIEGIAETLTLFKKSMTAQENADSADQLFHSRIAAAMHNSILKSIIEGLWANMAVPLFGALSQRTGLPENQRMTIKDHEAIYEAIRDRNPRAARKAMHLHLTHVEEIMMREDD